MLTDQSTALKLYPDVILTNVQIIADFILLYTSSESMLIFAFGKMVGKVRRLTPVEFVFEVRDELSKVVWPTREQAIKLTLIVIGTSIAVGLFIGGLDLLLTLFGQRFIYK